MEEPKGLYDIKTKEAPVNEFPPPKTFSEDALQALKRLGYVPVARLGA